jgi:phenylacetate-CoA ligase
VKVKGMFLHPGTLQAAMKAFPEVSRFRAVVTRDGSRDLLTVRAEAPPSVANDGLKGRIEERLREGLRIGATVEWAGPETLPADGKVIEDLRKWD